MRKDARRGGRREMRDVGERIARVLVSGSIFVYSLYGFPFPSSLAPRPSIVEAAQATLGSRELEAGQVNEGGPGASSSTYKHKASIGGPFGTGKMSSSRYRMLPGVLGETFTGPFVPIPAQDLDLPLLYAKIDPLGARISAQTWQTDADPIFIWSAPAGGTDIAGYSYAINTEPDETVDTTATSLNIATDPSGPLSDGKHIFWVKAVNSAGNSGRAVSFEIWIDTVPPQITSYSPSAGALLNVSQLSVGANISDLRSGVDETTLELSVNGQVVGTTFDMDSQRLTSRNPVSLREGSNSMELRASDLVGNSQLPLLWSVNVDSIPPTGIITVNSGAVMTTSVYVTLSLSATDETSAITAIRLSNDPTGSFTEEPYAAKRELWRLNAVRGLQNVYVKFVDAAGNESSPVTDDIELVLLAPETVITSGPVGMTLQRDISFSFMCPEGGCVFSYAFDNEEWSEWSVQSEISRSALSVGNHYFRVKAAKDVNGIDGIQSDEEDPSHAQRSWAVGIEPPIFTAPQGPPIKIWRLE